MNRAQVKHDELIAAYQNIAGDKDGMKVLCDILEYCGLMVTGASSSENLWMREGQKDVARFIINRLQSADHENYPKLLMVYARQAYEEQKHVEQENG